VLLLLLLLLLLRLRRGAAIVVTEEWLLDTALVQLGVDERAALCYTSRDRPAGRCVGLEASYLTLKQVGEVSVTDDGSSARHVVLAPLATTSHRPHGAAALCYQKGPIAACCTQDSCTLVNELRIMRHIRHPNIVLSLMVPPCLKKNASWH
jgi:hypothetical protein